MVELAGSEGEDAVASPFKKIGTKKQRKMKEKAEKKVMREVRDFDPCVTYCLQGVAALLKYTPSRQQEEVMREDRKKREALREEERKRAEAEEKEQRKQEVGFWVCRGPETSVCGWL